VSRDAALPFCDKPDFDVGEYVTEKALDGLFHFVAEQEKMIRGSDENRGSDCLKEVFGSQDNTDGGRGDGGREPWFADTTVRGHNRGHDGRGHGGALGGRGHGSRGHGARGHGARGRGGKNAAAADDAGDKAGSEQTRARACIGNSGQRSYGSADRFGLALHTVAGLLQMSPDDSVNLRDGCSPAVGRVTHRRTELLLQISPGETKLYSQRVLPSTQFTCCGFQSLVMRIGRPILVLLRHASAMADRTTVGISTAR
jgi:hypothetical protein